MKYAQKIHNVRANIKDSLTISGVNSAHIANFTLYIFVIIKEWNIIHNFTKLENMSIYKRKKCLKTYYLNQVV